MRNNKFEPFFIWIFLLRFYTAFLAFTGVWGVFLWRSLDLSTLYFLPVYLIFCMFFSFSFNTLIFSKTGQVVSYLFCIAIVIRLIYEIYHPREFITLSMTFTSQHFHIIAALLWCILIQIVMAKIDPPENKS